jgi:pyridoxamine 5'-phosphate oxidase
MTLPPWRSRVSRALHRNRSLPSSRYLQLATVDTNGHPRNRTVVFRGWQESNSQLKFITDRRSAKIDQIDCVPEAEICWYFAKTREQFRIAGEIKSVGEDNIEFRLDRVRLWQSLSANSQVQFAWPPSGEDRQDSTFDRDFTLDLDPLVPPANFILLLFNPSRLDHLELRGEPQSRYLYCLLPDRTWTERSINP